MPETNIVISTVVFYCNICLYPIIHTYSLDTYAFVYLCMYLHVRPTSCVSTYTVIFVPDSNAEDHHTNESQVIMFGLLARDIITLIVNSPYILNVNN